MAKWLDFNDIWPWPLTLSDSCLSLDNYRSDYDAVLRGSES